MPTPLILERRPRPLRDFVATLWHSIWTANRPLILVVGVHLLCVLAVSARIDVPFYSEITRVLINSSQRILPALAGVWLVWRFFYMALYVRPESPLRWFACDLFSKITDWRRLLSGGVVIVFFALFISCFTYLKEAIPFFDNFSWDPTFAQWDRELHGGQDPYQFLMPYLGTPVLTTAINAAYNLWFYVLYGFVLIAALDTHHLPRRNTFLVSFVLVWFLGGNALATALASAGPVYYEAMGHGGDFVPLMESLHRFNETSPVWALEIQQILLDGYHNGGSIKGISAMPSMHVASTVLMACYAFTLRHWAGWLMVLYALIIQIGSVHLAWHYAIDGYLGAFIALLVWAMVARVSRSTFKKKSCFA